MKISNRVYGLLALLLMGSASLMAQITDPFPDVPYRDYYGNMLVTAKAMMNGEVLTGDVVIAIYYEDQIRGKGSPTDNSRPGVTYLTVYGDYSPDHFHCKVAVEGKIIEVDPDDLAYEFNGVVGSLSNPYIINVPLVTTTPGTEGWATTCLPYNAEVPAGVSVYAATGIEDSELIVEQLQNAILPANTPVLVNADAPVEWLARLATGDAPAANIFAGTTAETTVDANSVLTLGHSNETGEIGFWCYTGTTIAANRAYIADLPTNAPGLTIAFANTMGIRAVDSDSNGRASAASTALRRGWYSLDGRRLSGKPTVRGLYVNNGRKVVIN